MLQHYILDLGQRVMDGEEPAPEEVLEILRVSDADMPLLLAVISRITREKAPGEVDFCAVVNARAGRCSEDCVFCAQSVHYGTDGPAYPLLDPGSIVEAAQRAKAAGAKHFGLVTAGRGPGRDLRAICAAVEKVIAETGLRVDCSLGLLTREEARALKEAGVTRYHHNLETARSHFGRICSTHGYDDKIQTLVAAREAGLELCSGCIIGLGESHGQIVELAFALKELGVDSVPVNFLNPIPGTPLAEIEGGQPLSALEMLRALAVFRLVMPAANIRVAGGREKNLRDLQALSLWAGANALMIGDYLTTPGRPPATDRQMVEDLGLAPARP
ncbi:MAG: biotin synthase BioB [Peptococcaceae bacterium]|nr:biotin synthase BioB [Peptococcaceae bacterium]